MTNVFQQAYSAVQNVDDIVEARIKDAKDTSSSLQTTALGTIDALKGLTFVFDGGDLPAPPDIDPNINLDLNLPEITPTSFGEITSSVPDRPMLEDVPGLNDMSIPDFASSVGSLNIPEAPAWTAPTDAPARPTTGEVDMPSAPDIVLPSLPTLVEIDVPDFAGLMLPEFSADSPEFMASALPGILQWNEPVYHSVVIDEVVEVIRRLWSGGSGIPPAVEEAMFERAMSREDTMAEREIGAVSDEYSARGFTMPTGMQTARVDQMRQDLMVKKLAFTREMTIKIAEWQVENVRFAVQQGLAAENVYVNLFLNSTQRLFEAAKFEIESQVNIYNAQVSLYNAQMNGYQVEAQVFDIKIKAEMSKIEIFKAEIDAEIARGQINEQKVRTYTAQVQGAQAEIEIFKARMQGASIQSDVIKSKIDAYSVDVRAYGERIQADKTRFDAYESQVKGEAAKAGIIDSEARAYAALIQGKSAVANIDVKRAELIIQKNRAHIEGYIADLDAEKARIQSQAAVIQSSAQAYTADTQRFSAQAQAETAKAQVTVAAKEAELRTNVSFYQARVQAYIGNMEQLIRQASLAVDALKAAGQLSSTLAAGAMAGVHVGATLSGSGGVSAGGQYSESNSKQNTTSTSTTYSYEGT